MKVYFKGCLTVLALALAALVFVTLATQPARAAGPWYVAPGGDDSNDCLSVTTVCATINGAIAKASSGDTIYVATGTYTGTGDEVVLLNKNATLSGGWDGTFTTQSGTSTIDGQGSRRGVTVNTGVTAFVERFTVQNGDAIGDGGGIYNAGTLTLNNSTVSGNTATWNNAGGIYNSGTLTLTNSTISDNTSSLNGGGIGNYGTLTLNNSTVSGNTAHDVGGGIGNWDTLTLNNSTVRGNTASSDGGIRNDGGTLTLSNSTVSGNTASRNGGIGNWGTLTLNNSTVSDNTANDVGGGISHNSGTATLQNTILAGNTASSAPDCSGTVGSAGYNLVGDTSGCTFSPGMGDLTDVNANLGQLIGAPGVPRYHPLLSGSPAIDAGNPADCTDHLGNPLLTDQRGAARVGFCDIGAYEYTSPGPAASISAIGGTPQRTPPFVAFGMPLQAAVLDSIGSPVSTATVTFSAPASGTSGTFVDSGTFTTTAVTNESGVATAATFTANGLMGSYTVTATVGGVVTPANFLLGNIGWYVALDGDDSNDCLSPGTACATINGALGKADPDDTVLVATGTYTGTGSSEVVLLDKDATLSGGWDGAFTTQSGTSTIDGEDARRGISVNSGVTAIVERFTVQNGSASNGGGIRNADGTLTLNDSTVSGNMTDGYGGGIYNQGTLTLNSSSVSGNTGLVAGGGIYNWAGNSLTLNNSTVSDNIAGSGGGIYNYGGTAILNNSTINGNTAWRGGGIVQSGGTLTLNNSTVSDNTASEDGGGIYNQGTLTLNSSTVSDNTASEDGGGIYVYGGTVTLQNTILAGNTAGSGSDCSGLVAIGSAGYNLIGDTSGCTFTPGTGDVTNINANLGPLSGSPGYHPLLFDSLAINAGNPTGCTDDLGNPLTTDQRGFARFGRCDIGAYEAQSIKTVNESTALPSDPLTYTIAFQNGSVNIANFRITDTMPIFLTYSSGSLTATSGSYGYHNGVITWTGSVNVGGAVTITFGATVSHTTPLGIPITNSAIISGGGETITRTATVDIGSEVEDITISGPTRGFVQAIYPFIATISPITAVQPIIYVWEATGQSPVMHTGGLSDIITFTWSTTGTQAITVTATNAGGTVTGTHVVSINEPSAVFLPILFCNYCPDFFDDFSNPASGWSVVDDSFVRSEYLNGEFRILTKKAGYFYLFRAPTCDRQNYVVEADARWVGTPGQSYGLIFGVTAGFSRYYLFDMNTDFREFGLLRRDPSGFTTVVPATYSAAINGGTASNHLKVTRNGAQITLEVNGTVLGTWSDGTITGFTGVGIVSSPYSSRPTSDARFDNFSVVSLLGGGATAQELSGVTAEVGDLQISGAHRALADTDQWPRRDDVEPEIK